jgi:hypothetical protein
MVGEGHQAVQELVGGVSRGLMVRVGSVDNAALMGDFTYDMWCVRWLWQSRDLIDRHSATYGQRGNGGCLQGRRRSGSALNAVQCLR